MSDSPCLACQHEEDQHDNELEHCTITGCGCTRFLANDSDLEDEVEELNFDNDGT